MGVSGWYLLVSGFSPFFGTQGFILFVPLRALVDFFDQRISELRETLRFYIRAELVFGEDDGFLLFRNLISDDQICQSLAHGVVYGTCLGEISKTPMFTFYTLAN